MHKGHRQKNWIVWLYGQGWRGSFPQTEVLAEGSDFLLSPPPEGSGRYHIWVSINLVNTFHLSLVIPRCHPTQIISSHFSFQMACFGCVYYFPQSPQRLTNPKQAPSGLGMPCTSCPSLALVSASLSSQLRLSWAPPSPAQVATFCRSFCCFY